MILIVFWIEGRRFCLLLEHTEDRTSVLECSVSIGARVNIKIFFIPVSYRYFSPVLNGKYIAVGGDPPNLAALLSVEKWDFEKRIAIAFAAGK